MSEPEQEITFKSRLQTVLDQLQAGTRTWDDLRSLTKIKDDNLGLTILDLLNQRKIWATKKDDIRLYGLERRKGLVPRFAHEQRRATDRSI